MWTSPRYGTLPLNASLFMYDTAGISGPGWSGLRATGQSGPSPPEPWSACACRDSCVDVLWRGG